MQKSLSTLWFGLVVFLIAAAVVASIIFYNLRTGTSFFNATDCQVQAARACNDCAFYGRENECENQLSEYCKNILNEKDQYLHCDRYLK